MDASFFQTVYHTYIPLTYRESVRAESRFQSHSLSVVAVVVKLNWSMDHQVSFTAHCASTATKRATITNYHSSWWEAPCLLIILHGYRGAYDSSIGKKNYFGAPWQEIDTCPGPEVVSTTCSSSPLHIAQQSPQPQLRHCQH
jgi:hypothetical protein